MQKSIFTKAVSVLLTLLLCAGCIIGTGVVSVNAANPDLYLRGTFNGWGADAKSRMSSTDNIVYTLTIDMKAGEHKFKIADANWGNQINDPNGDSDQNFLMHLDYNSKITFTVNRNAQTKLSYSATPVNSISKARNNVTLRCAWDQHNSEILVQEDDKLTIRNMSSEDVTEMNYLWNIIPAETGAGVYMQNAKTSKYLAVDTSNAFVFVDEPSTWGVNFVGGNMVFKHGNNCINIEDYDKGVALSYQPAKNTSAQWVLPLDYKIEADKIIGADYEAVANSGKSITSNATGEAKTWNLSKKISGYPQIKAEESPMLEAVYNLALEEVVENIYTDPDVGTAYKTGDLWNKVWTRDSAYANILSLAWLDPEISDNCNRKKVHTDKNTGVAVFEQDTGTGGSYPVSTDKIILLTSVWETYLTDGKTENLEYFYDVTYNTMMQDLHVAMDGTTGLFKGETGGIDWRDQTYPDWMSSMWNSGMVDIAEGKSAVVNATYVRAYEIMARMADILGKGQEAIDFWTTAATKLEEAMSKQLWSDDLGIYASWMYPEYMGNTLSTKGDIQGNGYALWFDVGTDDQIQSILDNYPLVNFGAPTTYPQKLGKGAEALRYYHNRGVWPGWQTIMMVGANLQGNEEMAEEIFDSNIHCSAAYLSNYEVVNYETGEGVESENQLWSVAGTLAGYYRLIFGMNYDENGITFNPTVQDWVKGAVTLSNYKYRNATLNITVNGTGDKVTKFVVNGKEEDINTYVLPTDATGAYTIEMTVDGNEDTDTFKQGDKYLAICPSMPSMSYNSTTGTLSWTPAEGLDYYIWTGVVGSEYIKVTGQKTYAVDKNAYGAYSLMSYNPETGLYSELSEPIIVSPARIKIEAEDGYVSSSSLIQTKTKGYSGKGYVVDSFGSANLQILVNVPTSGKYYLSSVYNNIGDAQSGISCGIRSVTVDGKDTGTMIFPETYDSYKYQESSHLVLELSAGKHIIGIDYAENDWYDQNMAWYTQFDSSFDLGSLTGIRKNEVQYDYFVLDLAEAKDVDMPALDPGTTLPETPDTKIFTVAGEAGLCGSSWNPADTNNDMTSLGNGIYQKVYTNIKAGTYMYKITKDHSWNESYGVSGGNSTVAVEKDGSTVTITFDDNTKTPSAKVDFVEPTDPPTPPTPTDPTDDTKPVEPSYKLKNSTINAGSRTRVTVYNANGKKVTYKSSKTTVAKIDKNGIITGLKQGTTKLTIKVGTKVFYKNLKVKNDPTVKDGKKVLKNKKTIVVRKGQTKKLTITGKASAIKNKVSVKSKKIAKITSNTKQTKIVFKAMKRGKTTLTVTINGAKTYKYTIKVK